MINSRLAVAIHILSIISVDEKASSEIIADSVNTNPVVVRRMISLLKKLIFSHRAQACPGQASRRTRQTFPYWKCIAPFRNRRNYLRFMIIRIQNAQSAKGFNAH